MVESGESCTYPGTTVEFSVDSSGSGRFLIFSNASAIQFEGATISGVIYNFVAKAQRDQNYYWLVARNRSGCERSGRTHPVRTACARPTEVRV